MSLKLKCLSDLHLEGCSFKYQYDGEDILVLAGDIATPRTFDAYMGLFDMVPSTTEIILIAGNHDYWHGNFFTVNENLGSFQRPDIIDNRYPNVHFLKNRSIDFGNYSFFGGTMFTDFNVNGETFKTIAMFDAARMIPDFKYIRVYEENELGNKEEWYWTTKNHIEQYEIFNREFDAWIKSSEGKTRICVSHFLPSEKSVAPRFLTSSLNPYFATNNENRVQLVDYWLHGHTHDSFDYMLGDTRVICNPKGYGDENLEFNPNLIIEI